MDYSRIISELTSNIPTWTQSRRLNDFAAELGWRPTDHLDLPLTKDFSSGHLIVEHGLEYTAIITFLSGPYRFSSLTPPQKKHLLNASYNNLIDWNIAVDEEGVNFIFNRYRPPDFYVVRRTIEQDGYSALQSSTFRQIALGRPAANVPALDRAVIDTISIWKRQVGGVYPGVTNSALSALFNAILLIRAAEDDRRYRGLRGREPLLPEIGGTLAQTGHFTIGSAVTRALDQLHIGSIPLNLIDLASLAQFDDFEPALALELFDDFYRNRFARYYEFDFRLMSKHALSRIYEHYVSVLRVTDSDQTSFLPKMAEEEADRKFGNVYTPEFIARFFARYLRLQIPLRSFQRLKIADPACGSGIFLRAFSELQNEVLVDSRTTQAVRETFDGLVGIDVDPNACHAARLSMSLLSLFLLGEFPETLKIFNDDSLTYFLGHPELKSSFDVLVANPPYVKFETQSLDQRALAAKVLNEYAFGRPDLYLVMLKIALDCLKPGGYGLFVLPETFLKADSAKTIRMLIAQRAEIHAIVDLTAIRVFEDVGVYPILLIFEMKSDFPSPAKSAKIVQCRGNTPAALQDLLDDRLVETSSYSIYETSQDAFGENWSLSTPDESRLLRKLALHPTIEQDYVIRQGMNTGADDVFIVDVEVANHLEMAAFLPLLSDKEMGIFSVPSHAASVVFYPFVEGNPLDETTLKDRYPKTWAYLSNFEEKLSGRASVVRGTIPWWRPERPRQPEEILRRKIVTPHLVVAPRFSYDALGNFGVSRSPFITAKRGGASEEFSLLYLLAILNSSVAFWDISRRSHIYSRGYSRLEKATLRLLRVPSLSDVVDVTARRLVKLVEARLVSRGPSAFQIESEIDQQVAELYGLDDRERLLIGMGAIS